MAKTRMPSFTRGGMPTNSDPVKVTAHPKTSKPGGTRGYGVGEWVALGVAGGLTGLVGAATVSALREGFGGDNRFGGKKK